MTGNTWNWVGAHGQGWSAQQNGLTLVWQEAPGGAGYEPFPQGGDRLNIVAGQAASVGTFVNYDNLISGAGVVNLRTYVNGCDLKGTATVDATGVNAFVILAATLDNFGVLESTNPNNLAGVGGLALSNATIDQTTTNRSPLGLGAACNAPTEVVKADGAHTHVDLAGATIEGGQLLALNGGFSTAR